MTPKKLLDVHNLKMVWSCKTFLKTFLKIMIQKYVITFYLAVTPFDITKLLNEILGWKLNKNLALASKTRFFPGHSRLSQTLYHRHLSLKQMNMFKPNGFHFICNFLFKQRESTSEHCNRKCSFCHAVQVKYSLYRGRFIHRGSHNWIRPSTQQPL